MYPARRALHVWSQSGQHWCISLRQEVDLHRCWDALLGACDMAWPDHSAADAAAAKGGMDIDAQGSAGADIAAVRTGSSLSAGMLLLSMRSSVARLI